MSLEWPCWKVESAIMKALVVEDCPIERSKFDPVVTSCQRQADIYLKSLVIQEHLWKNCP